MHEQSVIDALVKKILNIAKKENAQLVTKVKVRLGAFCHMDEGHFKEHFIISAAGTIAQDAIIEAELSNDEHDENAHFVTLLSIDVTS
ncbi:MAG: hydrogenase maturation nickel metallochaperone HypA [Chlamydiae bacterium]|nr:hydrogenase maturation nickel metallochaperone HypA [Chlamydiota bacterium]